MKGTRDEIPTSAHAHVGSPTLGYGRGGGLCNMASVGVRHIVSYGHQELAINRDISSNQRSWYSLGHWSSLRCRNLPVLTIFDETRGLVSGRIPRMSSCASLLTSTARARYSRRHRRLLFTVPGCSLVSSLVVTQHRRSFVFKVLVKELSIRSIMIRWLYPFPWYNAWESYAYASGAIEPAGAGAASQFFAEIRGEVVTVFGEQVIGCAHELLRSLV